MRVKIVKKIFVLALMLGNLVAGSVSVTYGAQAAKQVDLTVSNQSVSKVLEGVRVSVQREKGAADQGRNLVLTSGNFELKDLQKAAIDNYANVTGVIEVKAGKEHFEGLFVITYSLEDEKWVVKDAAKNVFVNLHEK